MAFVRITSITKGANGTCAYNGEKLDAYYAKKVGLLKWSYWLHDLSVGDSVIVPLKDISAIKNAGKGVFEIELEHPKYANQIVGSDVYAFEVVKWTSETTVVLRELDTTDYDDIGEYCNKYVSNPNNPLVVVREHKNGGLYETGSNYCPYILSDKPYYRRDPSF